MSQFDLMKLILTQPGVTYSELIKKTGLGNSSVSHSLKQLIKYNGVIKIKKQTLTRMGHTWISTYYPKNGVNSKWITNKR